MNFTFATLFADSLIMLEVAFVWCPVVVVTTCIALLALVLALGRRTRKVGQWVAMISLATSLAPTVVLIWYSEPLALYGHNIRGGVLSWMAFSLLPILISAAGLWQSRKPLPTE
jgi:hypothetical protein